MKLWTGQSISLLGTQITLLAMPFAAILLLHASPFEVGLLTTIEYLPFLLVGLPAGVWVDRMRRRPILIAGDLGRAVALISVPIAHGLGLLTLPQLYVVSLVTGVLTVFFDVSWQSYLPSIVRREQLVEGNSKLEISRSGTQLAGPGLAGGLVQLVGAATAIVGDAVSYVVSAVFVGAIRRSEPPVEKPAVKPRMRAEIGEGLRYVLRNRYLRSIAACTGSANFFESMILAIFVLYAVRVLGLSPGLIGLVFAIGNAGAVIGAFLSGWVPRRFGIGPAIILGAITFAPPVILIPLAPKSFPLPFLITSLALTAAGGVVYNVNNVGFRQAITPLRMQGRMNATMRFIVWGTMPLGALIGGTLGGLIGLRPTLFIAAIPGMLTFLPVLLSPLRRLREIPAVAEEDKPPPEPVVPAPVPAKD